jgi:hypothetical protein
MQIAGRTALVLKPRVGLSLTSCAGTVGGPSQTVKHRTHFTQPEFHWMLPHKIGICIFQPGASLFRAALDSARAIPERSHQPTVQ